MTQQELDHLLDSLKKRPSEDFESDTLEFKLFQSEKALHNAKDLAEEFSALANHLGGHIIVGVCDSCEIKNSDWNSQLVGFPKVDLHTTQERLSGKLRPKQLLELKEFEYEGKNYLVIKVPRRYDSLVSTTSGKVCTRDGKSSRAMEPNEIERAVKLLQDYDWSAQYLEDLVSNDALDSSAVNEAFNDFVNRRGAHDITIPDFLEAIGVTSNGILTKSGLLFLGTSDAIKSKRQISYRMPLAANWLGSHCLSGRWSLRAAFEEHRPDRYTVRFHGCDNWEPVIFFVEAAYQPKLKKRYAKSNQEREK